MSRRQGAKPSKSMFVIRIDPMRHTVAMIDIGWKRDYTRDFKRLLKSDRIGHYTAGKFGGRPMIIAADPTVPDGTKPGFKLRGVTKESTVGLAILFGQGGQDGHIVDCPLGRSQVERLVVWVTGEEAMQEDREGGIYDQGEKEA